MTPKRIPPGPGQSSVWDYPRPPRVEPTSKHLQVVFNGVLIADTSHARCGCWKPATRRFTTFRRADIQMQYLERTTGRSMCEWKGLAWYYSVTVGDARTECCLVLSATNAGVCQHRRLCGVLCAADGCVLRGR